LKLRTGYLFRYLFTIVCLLFCSDSVFAQVMTQPNSTVPGANGVPQRDTNANKSNTNKWKEDEARISFHQLNSEKKQIPDTSLHTYHRRPFLQPWYRDLGNLGSPVENLQFTPENRMGPTLGYHVYDVYRFYADSLNYYNTTRPYSVFSYQLGSKLEQMVSLFHTQNIKPNWNFAVEYRKVNSPGFYKLQRTIHDNANLTTNYKSRNLHYELYGAVVYNKFQQDENGGIINDSELLSSQYNDRKTIDVGFQNDNYSTLRSSVSNMQRDFGILLQHSYSWGNVDTTYNSDSTQYYTHLVRRFSITHKMQLGSEKHVYKDILPDSLRYTSLFQQGFNGNFNTGFSTDSVFSQQKWFWIDNRILLNGFVGPSGKQLEFDAGVGNRVDQFNTNYVVSNSSNNILSNYVVGELKKEAIKPGQWFYNASAQLYLTGDAAGDFLVNANAGKDLNNNLGSISAGFKQQLNSVPYSYTIYENQYYKAPVPSYDKESVTQFYATIESPRFNFTAGIRDYVIENYIYINQKEQFAQYTTPFSVTAIWGRKAFRFGKFILDNELCYQQIAGSAPVNVPTLMGRHQLSYEVSLFNRALKLATGVELRYHTAYYCAGYDPFLNRFYYQNSYYLSNEPGGSIFFNFRIKRFRAYLMADQVQEIFTRNTIAAPGYPAQDFMVRFGFAWVLVN